MKIRVGMSMGLEGCHREAVLDIPDNELDGMSDEEIDDLCEEYARAWLDEILDYWWEVET